MSKNRDLGNITNVIKTDANGNITFVSGSATLFSISSSGAVTTTGVISGSAAASATSASYAVSSSYADAFTVKGQITAQTLVVQTITSSVEYSSGSNVFGNSVGNTHQFTGSIFVSGSVGIGVASLNGSLGDGSGIELSSIGYIQTLRSSGSSFVSGRTGTTGNIANFMYGTSLTNASQIGSIGTDGNGLYLLGGAGSTSHLYISSSGATTFASSVTANGVYVASGNYLRLYNGSAWASVSFDGTQEQHNYPAVYAGSLTSTGQSVFSYAGKDALIVQDTTSQAAGVGGSILFRGVYTNGSNPLPFGRISLMKENSTAADYSFGMGFYTSANGGNNPSTNPNMYIAGSGNVGIGTTTPSGSLHLNGAAPYVYITTTNGARTWVAGADSNGYVIYDNTAGAYRTTLSPAGNFGIGTTSPSYKLTVAGTIGATDMVLGSTFSYSYATDSTWQSAMQTIIPANVLNAGTTYLVKLWWIYGSGNSSPYYAIASTLINPCIQNGSGTGNAISLLTSNHTPSSGAYYNVATLGGGGFHSSGLAVQFMNFATAGGTLSVWVTQIA